MTRRKTKCLGLCVPMLLAAVAGFSTLRAQTGSSAGTLPDAPPARLMAAMQRDATAVPHQAGRAPDNGSSTSLIDARPRLTLADAEAMAIKNNPGVGVAHLLALAQHQVARETRAAEMPTLTGSVTAEEAANGSRISAGALTSSSLFEHAGAGATLTQLITDFGRTGNLVASAKLEERARNANAQATTEDILLATDQAFFDALQAQALLKVADQNVDTRQTTDSQVGEMTRNKLKSTLDASFADVNLSQAKLLQLDAENNVDSAMAALDAVLGLDHHVEYNLVDSGAALDAPPPDAELLEQLALRQRPDLQALDLSRQAAVKFSHAQRDQVLPSIRAAGTAGSVPIRPAQYYNQNWWGGIGINLNVPIFDGFFYSAEAKEASIRAQAASEQSRDLRDRIVRDVRTAWLAANTAYRRVAVTADLLKQANLALSLAQTRYQLGLSSIVELSQAQFQQTDAAIGNTNAHYQYQLSLAALNFQTGTTP